MATLTDQTTSHEAMLEELAKLRAENERLKQRGHGIKVSDKGAVSVYGLGRFPVTLYRTQWEKLIDKIPEVEAFIKANAHRLASKDD